MQQGALLRYVVGVLCKYFTADGSGLSEAVAKSEQFHQLEDKVTLYAAATPQLIAQYLETQVPDQAAIHSAL